MRLQPTSVAGPRQRAYAFSADVPVPQNGASLYLNYGTVSTSASPLIVAGDGNFRGASISVDRVDADRTYELRILKGWMVVETLTLPAGSATAVATAFSAAFSSGDAIRVVLVRTGGPGTRSTFRNVTVSLEMEITG